MPIKKIHRYIAVCDVCQQPMRFGTDSEIEYTPNYGTRRDAQAAVDDNEWTDLGRGRIACTASDPAHDDARDAALSRRA
ncbi:hypothetical protein ACFC8N_42620 [Streptomyces sp. NPDC055966]|uniref:hypothetical protein n=1 Tax=Streptomyces sp. NPDC055966 TaxID=3345669 RepID=UPI0035D7ACFE